MESPASVPFFIGMVVIGMAVIFRCRSRRLSGRGRPYHLSFRLQPIAQIGAIPVEQVERASLYGVRDGLHLLQQASRRRLCVLTLMNDNLRHFK
jgi:hypothetical protein